MRCRRKAICTSSERSCCCQPSLEQRGDAFQALGDRVDVDVQRLAGARQVAVVAEVGLEGGDQLGATLFVVVQNRSDGASHERYDVTPVAEQHAQEAELGGAGTLAGPPERLQRLEAAHRLPSGRRNLLRSVNGRRRTGGHRGGQRPRELRAYLAGRLARVVQRDEEHDRALPLRGQPAELAGQERRCRNQA